MKHTHTILLSLFLCSSLTLSAMTREDYQQLNNKSGDGILETLYKIISSHNDVGYKGLYDVYKTSDIRDDGTIWDMYSDCPFAVGNTCGSYNKVCMCYNREHSVPQSWFSGSHMQSDAFHVYPTDGYVNNQRGNHPFGECQNGTYLDSKARGKLGSSTFSGYSGQVFEPDDEYKGDFARSYFYMVACYLENTMAKSEGSAMFTYSGNKSNLTTYAINLLMRWHRLDPVSDKEIARNEAVYKYQNNRNPFIDYPCLAEYIWGDKQGEKIDFSTLADCKTSDPGKPDPKEEDPKDFEVLSVSNIHAHSVELNWTDAKVDDYIVDVYTKQESSDVETTLLLDELTDSSKGTVSGYTQFGEESGAVRLGSGSKIGSIVYTGLELATNGYVRVKAKAYKSDSEPTFTIQVGTEKQQFTATADYADYTMEFTAQGTVNVTITTDATKKRIYVDEVEIVVGGAGIKKMRVEGYPMSVGNVLSHRVEGLDGLTQYFYTVQPNGMDVSDEFTFFTEEGWTGFNFVTFPTVDCYAAGGELIMRGLPENANISIYTTNGQLVKSFVAAQAEYTYSLSSGLYLVLINLNGKTQTFKVRL